MKSRCRKIVFLVITLYLIAPSLISAQYKSAFISNTQQDKFSQPVKLSLNETAKTEETEKNFILPAIEVVNLNLGVWIYNRYLTKEGWSEIGINTIKQNLETGFTWDNDGFLMNQFAHPYHGSQYYSAARSNGLSFWESAIYPYGGSLMWELFMENQAPSYNDIINTPVSGILIGEITYRLSDLIIDESKTGLSRVLTETAALIVNPMHAFNRLIKGQVWRMGENKPGPDFVISASVGSNSIFFDNKRENRKTYALVRLNMTYGDLMNTAAHEKPFDYFTVRSEMDFIMTDNISTSSASGVIWDTPIKIFNASKDIFGIYKELDLFINTIYKFTATQATSRITSNAILSENSNITSSIGMSAIFLGGINSKYASIEGKDYNLGPGIAISIMTKYQLSKLISLNINYKKYWIHTVSGAAGEDFAGYFNAFINFHLTKHSFLGAEYTLYHRHAYYEKYAATSEYDSSIKTYYTFAF